MAEAILFDLNGTLLDLSALDPPFAAAFGDAGARERWFGELEVLWMTTIAAGGHRSFDELSAAALRMLAARERVDLADADAEAILDRMSELPAYPDVAPALTTLRAAGLRLAVLTNGTEKAAESQVGFAGWAGRFEAVFSVDRVGRYKPAPEPYRFAAAALGVEPRNILMVAAHAWDVAGAHAAGMKTAFLARRGRVPNPLGPAPDCQAADMETLAARILG